MTVPAEQNYKFLTIEKCDMCGSSTESHKLLGQRLNQSLGLRPRRKKGISVSVMKCNKCSLIYSQPQPIPHNIQDHYGTPPESYWSDTYFQPQPNYFSGQIEEVKKLLPFKSGMKALDIGAGLGKCIIALENAGFQAQGFEPSDPFFERAINKMGISPEKLKFGMLEEMNYSPESFDFITFGAVLEHLYSPSASLEKAMSWLKPRGIIHIEVPSSRHLIGKIFNMYYRLQGTNYVTHLSPMHAPFHLYEFHINSFLRLGEKLRFIIEKHQVDVCDILHIPLFMHPILKKIMEWTGTGLQLTVYLRRA